MNSCFIDYSQLRTLNSYFLALLIEGKKECWMKKPKIMFRKMERWLEKVLHDKKNKFARS